MSVGPAPFKDQGKSVNDLLNKGFPSTDKFLWKFEFDTISQNGVQLLPNFTRANNNELSGEFKLKTKQPNSTYTLSAKTDQNISLEVASSQLFSGIKPTLTFSSNMQNLNKFKTKLNLEAVAENFNGNLAAEIPNPLAKEGSNKLNLSTVVGDKTCGFAIGAEVEVNADKQTLDKANGLVSYTSKDAQITLFNKRTREDKEPFTITNLFGFNAFHQIPNGWKSAAVGSEITYNFQKCSFLIGAQFKPDDSSTVKFRIKNDGTVGVSYTQHWGGVFSSTLMGESRFGNVESALQWGIKINLK